MLSGVQDPVTYIHWRNCNGINLNDECPLVNESMLVSLVEYQIVQLAHMMRNADVSAP